jgi:hypothetical protein
MALFTETVWRNVQKYFIFATDNATTEHVELGTQQNRHFLTNYAHTVGQFSVLWHEGV